MHEAEVIAEVYMKSVLSPDSLITKTDRVFFILQYVIIKNR
jgi:hypothetical protein